MDRIRKMWKRLGFMRRVDPRGPLRSSTESAWPKFTEALAEMFREHGIEAVTDGDRVVFPEHGGWGAVSFCRVGEFPHVVNVRSTFRFEFDAGPQVVECFAGPGETDAAAAVHGFESFVAGSLHVILATFFRPPDDQVTVMEWIVGGRPRRVILGNAVTKRMGSPAEPGDLIAFFPHLEARIRAADLPNGIHWVRVFAAQLQGELIAVEVLLDNEPWHEMREIVAAANWPCEDDYYSLRLFLTICDP